MDRRSAFGAICTTLASGGIAAIIGFTALQAETPYVRPLLYTGIVTTTLGFAGLIWLFVVRRQADAIATTRANVIDESVTSYGQIGGQTAHTIVNREPDPVPQRSLSPDQVRAMKTVLEGSGPKGTITEIQHASREHAIFSGQIADVFQQAGWKRQTLCTGSRDTPGGMKVGWQNARAAAYLVGLKALESAGLEFVEDEFRGPPTDVLLDVGILEMTAFQRAADRWPS